VRTTFVPALQDAAEQAVRNGLARFNDRGLQAALVAIDPRTGNILAMVGGRDFTESQYNRATRSRRQPGSAFKPLLFAAALEHGYSPVSIVSGLASIEPQGPDEWSPRNSDGSMTDALSLRAALLESNNRAATVLQQQVGSKPVLVLASHVGLRDMPDVPSLSLGTGLVTPLELTTAFAAFPNGGLGVTPRGIMRVLNGEGGVAYDNPIHTERVISPQTAFQMVSMLSDVIERGTGASVRRAGIDFPAGGKTGTTNDFKDAWFVGFSPSLVAGVWVGFDQPRPIGREAYGARYAAPLWTEFMRRAARIRAPGAFDQPGGLQEVTLCRVSYLKPVEGCPTYTEYLKPDDQAPSRLCTVHQGSIKQQVRRAIEGLLSGIGKKIRGIFR
jgi:penicillin-binding protein 1A